MMLTREELADIELRLAEDRICLSAVYWCGKLLAHIRALESPGKVVAGEGFKDRVRTHLWRIDVESDSLDELLAEVTELPPPTIKYGHIEHENGNITIGINLENSAFTCNKTDAIQIASALIAAHAESQKGNADGR